MKVPHQVTDCAASIGLMTVFLVGALALCAAAQAVGDALFR